MVLPTLPENILPTSRPDMNYEKALWKDDVYTLILDNNDSLASHEECSRQPAGDEIESVEEGVARFVSMIEESFEEKEFTQRDIEDYQRILKSPPINIRDKTFPPLD